MGLETYRTIVEVTEKGNNIVRVISAAEAYRKYNWLRKIPVTNSAGNLRGMVINAQARSVYEFTGKIGTYAGHLNILLSWAEECKRSSASFENIFLSKEDNLIKAAKISAQVSGIATRVLLGIATGAAQTGIAIVEYTRWINLSYWTDKENFNKDIIKAKSAINSVKVYWQNFTTSDGLYNFIQISI